MTPYHRSATTHQPLQLALAPGRLLHCPLTALMLAPMGVAMCEDLALYISPAFPLMNIHFILVIKHFPQVELSNLWKLKKGMI